MQECKKKFEDSKLARDTQQNHARGGSKSSLDAMDMSQPEKKKKKKVEETEKNLCGICLAEEDVNARGKMDSCEHYFCFACILEWAKVETRCPTCRQRFTTLSRPCGFRARGRTLNLPLRNQVVDVSSGRNFQKSEDETKEPVGKMIPQCVEGQHSRFKVESNDE